MVHMKIDEVIITTITTEDIKYGFSFRSLNAKYSNQIKLSLNKYMPNVFRRNILYILFSNDLLPINP